MVIPDFKQEKRYKNTYHAVLLFVSGTVGVGKSYLNATDCYYGL